MSTWIPISERMPTREETNGHDHVCVVDERGTHWIWDYVLMPISRFAHPPIAWHALPRYTPPKPEPTDEEIHLLFVGARGNSWVAQDIRRWFADVTARIEREEGK